jgi:hypothetical protein
MTGSDTRRSLVGFESLEAFTDLAVTSAVSTEGGGFKFVVSFCELHPEREITIDAVVVAMK